MIQSRPQRWLRRLLYLLFFLFWIALLLLPVVAFAVATNGELRLGGERRQLRLFMANDTAVEGVGFEWTRPSGGADQNWALTSLRYLTWRGKAEPARFCQCFDEAGQVVAIEPDQCPP